MSLGRQCGISGAWLLGMFATAMAMLLGMLALWLSFLSSSELDGRYQSSGQVQLSNGQVLDISHSLQVNNGRFYAMTRQGDMSLNDAELYAEAEETIIQQQGYSAESDAARLLDGLGIPADQHGLLLKTLSGHLSQYWAARRCLER